MKRKIALLIMALAAISALFCLTACGQVKEAATADNIEQLLTEQDVYCTGFTCQNDNDQYQGGDRWKSACVHGGTLVNNTDNEYRSATIYVCGFDEDGWPVSWRFFSCVDDGDYAAELTADDIKLAANEKSQLNYYWSNNANPTEATQFRFIVAEAELLDGSTWTNPYAEDWLSIYASQKLEN